MSECVKVMRLSTNLSTGDYSAPVLKLLKSVTDLLKTVDYFLSMR